MTPADAGPRPGQGQHGQRGKVERPTRAVSHGSPRRSIAEQRGPAQAVRPPGPRCCSCRFDRLASSCCPWWVRVYIPSSRTASSRQVGGQDGQAGSAMCNGAWLWRDHSQARSPRRAGSCRNIHRGAYWSAMGWAYPPLLYDPPVGKLAKAPPPYAPAGGPGARLCRGARGTEMRQYSEPGERGRAHLIGWS